MELKLRGLKEGEHKYSFREPAADYGLDAGLFPEDAVSEVTVNFQGKNYYITIDVDVDSVFDCDRCLESSRNKVETRVKLLCTEDQSLVEGNDEDGLYFLPSGEDCIVLNDDVRQGVMLVMPMKLICGEDCKGLCSGCGINLNKGSCDCTTETTDPRWDALKKLKQDIDEDN